MNPRLIQMLKDFFFGASVVLGGLLMVVIFGMVFLGFVCVVDTLDGGNSLISCVVVVFGMVFLGGVTNVVDNIFQRRKR